MLGPHGGRIRIVAVAPSVVVRKPLGLFPIIFPPQVAIVGFGKLVERPWISEGQILPCPVVTAGLAADHRVTDGHRASALLAAVDNLLQEPEGL